MTARPAPLTMTQEHETEARLWSAQTFAPDLAMANVAMAQFRAILAELDATRAQLAAVTLQRDMIATMPPVRTTPNGFACWCENFDGAGRYSYCHAMRKAHFALPALSPTQPTPTEGNEP